MGIKIKIFNDNPNKQPVKQKIGNIIKETFFNTVLKKLIIKDEINIEAIIYYSHINVTISILEKSKRYKVEINDLFELQDVFSLKMKDNIILLMFDNNRNT